MAVASPLNTTLPPERLPRQRAGEAVLFFGCFFLYVWLVLDPSLLYESTTYFPAFSLGTRFAARFLWLPGGPVKYLAALLYQAYYYAWGGALVTTALAALLYWAGGRVVRVLAGQAAPRWVRLIPALLLLIGAARYGCHLAGVLALTTALLAAAGYLSARERGLGPLPATLLYVGVCCLLSYTVAGPLLIFAVLCATYEARHGSARVVGWLYVLVAMVVPEVVGVRWLDVPAAEAWFASLPLGDWCDPHALDPLGPEALRALCLYSLLLGAVASVLARGGRRPQAAASRTSSTVPAGAAGSQSARHSWPASPGAPEPDKSVGRTRPETCPAARRGCATRRLGALLGHPAVACLLPVALLLLVGSVAATPTLRQYLRAQRCFRQGDWEGVLREVAAIRGPDVVIPLSHQVNAALAHRGRLLEDMFAYAQAPNGLLVGTAAGDARRQDLGMERLTYYPQLGEQDLALGLVNEAEHQAHEALEVWGPHPGVLWRLAEINCLRGETAAARVCLCALTRDLVWRPRARQALAELDRGAIPRAIEQTLVSVRPLALRDDSYLGQDFDWRCRALLRSNPGNRLALEYLLAYHLLRREPWWCAEDLGLLRDAGYQHLPRHVQEAMAVQEMQTGRAPNLQGYRIDPAIRARLTAFTALVAAAQAAGGPARARVQAAPEYGNTYFYYLVFGASGVGRL